MFDEGTLSCNTYKTYLLDVVSIILKQYLVLETYLTDGERGREGDGEGEREVLIAFVSKSHRIFTFLLMKQEVFAIFSISCF